MTWPKKRSNKYGAVKKVVNGKTCDSKLEARHYAKLLMLESKGAIQDLKFHPRYPVEVNGKKVCTVVLDFEYLMDGKKHYIDSKGIYTSESKLRHKLLEAIYDIKVEIWRK